MKVSNLYRSLDINFLFWTVCCDIRTSLVNSGRMFEVLISETMVKGELLLMKGWWFQQELRDTRTLSQQG